MTPTRIAFMGSDPIALPLLDFLHDSAADGARLVGVFTQPDRPSGRGLRLRANAIKEWAQKRNLPVRQPDRCGPDDEGWLRTEGIELVLVMAFGQLLRRSFIETPRLGTVNFHASLLPKLRGASPIHTAIATGEPETGVSLMRIVPKLDAGPVLDAERVPVAPNAQAPEVIRDLAACCVRLLRRQLPSLCEGRAVFEPQEESSVTYCRRITKEDAHLDFHRPAQALHDHIRAFQPWPGAQLEIEEAVLKVGKARLHPSTGGDPGTLLIEDSQVFVQCRDTSLELLALQRPGGRMLPTPEFLTGFPLRSGMVARSFEMRPLVSDAPFSRSSRPAK